MPFQTPSTYPRTSEQSVNQLTEDLNLTLHNTEDAVTPLKTKNICHKKLAPWYTENTKALKQSSRTFLRKWHCLGKDSTVQYRSALTAVQPVYFSNLIKENKNNPTFIFDTVAKLTKKQHSPREDGFHFSSDEFIHFFNEKIMIVRKQITDSSLNLHIQCLAKVFGPLELCDLLPHFRLQT